MTDAPPVGVVLDTMVISWLFDDRPNALADQYRALIGTRPALLSFQTVMGLRLERAERAGENSAGDASSAAWPNSSSSSPMTR